MTLLLKSVWQNVMRGRHLTRCKLRSRSLSSSISEISSTNSTDTVMISIKSAPSPADLLATVQDHLPTLTHKHMLQALRCLFLLHKDGGFNEDTESIVKDPGFGVLCQNFKKHARELDIREAIEATKVLSFLKVPVDSLIVQSMLQMIRSNINLINLRQIMFLDYILCQFETKNHLVDALKLALPLAFQIHLPLELDKEDLPLLRDMLAYSCFHELPDRCINNIVTALLLHDQAINAQAAKSIIWSLCHVNCTEERFPTRVQLLHICYDILAQSLDQLSYDEVLRTAAKIKGRVLEKHPEYYHEQLLDAIANYVINNEVDFEKSLLVSRVLSRVAHTHLGLMEYLCTKAVSSPTILSNALTNILFGFINCLSNNNFTPSQEQWNEIRRQISLNPVLHGKTNALPWTKICLELASLGYYDDRLLAKVFSKEYQENMTHNPLDLLQLLTLHEAVKVFHTDEYVLPTDILDRAKSVYPLQPLSAQLQQYLARGLGGNEYVARNVMLNSGIVADLLMCLKGGYPIKLPDVNCDQKVPIEALNIPPGTMNVCILNFKQGCFSLNSNRLRGTFRLILDILEKQGHAAVAVNVNEWLNTPPHERTPYLMREVGYKCGEMGMKLSAT